MDDGRRSANRRPSSVVCRLWLGSFIAWIQRVPDASHAAYQGALLVAQFVAQVADIYVHDVCVTEIVVAPHAVEDSFACEDLARMGQQHLQQVELAWGQFDLSLATSDLAGQPVERQVTCPQRTLQVDAFAAQYRPHARQQDR